MADLSKMSLQELREAALAEQVKEAAKPAEAPVEQPRDPATGRFQTQADHFDIPDDEAEVEAQRAAYAQQPTGKFVKVIQHDDGTVDRYVADDWATLCDKIAEGKRHATKQMRTITAEKRALEARLGQVADDEAFVWSQKLKENPQDVLLSAIDQSLEQRDAAKQREAEREQDMVERSKAAQEQFVQNHKEYVVSQGNAAKLVEAVKSMGFQELTTPALEAAFAALNAEGKLELKQPEPVSQPLTSVRRGSSTISVRNSGASFGNRNTGPSLEDLYDSKKYSTEDVRRLAEQQLRENRDKGIL